MTVQEALQNVNIVVENARMTGPERDALRESIKLVLQRCQRADELEKPKEVKVPNKIAKKLGKKDKKDGRADK